MKLNLKLLLLLLSVSFISNAQVQTKRGNFFIEAGTSAFGDISKKGASTGLVLFSSNGTTIYSVGAEGGFFISDNFGLKIGLGFTDYDDVSFFSYKGGIKYYLAGGFPIQIDLTGATRPNPMGVETPEPFWLGLQIGKALFLNENVSFEPSIRQNISMNREFADSGIFEANISFVIFLD